MTKKKGGKRCKMTKEKGVGVYNEIKECHNNKPRIKGGKGVK